MQSDDILAGASAAFSGLLAYLSYLWSIPILQFGFTFILGTFVTYLVQRKLQDRTDNRKIIRQNIERMYGPLKLELQEYKKSVIDRLEVPRSLVGSTDPSKSTWEIIKTYPESLSIPSDLQLQMEEITNIEQSIMRTLEESKKLVDSFIFNAVESVLGERLKKTGLIINDTPSNETLYITVTSSTGRHYGICYLHDCLLLDEDPIENARQEYPELSIDQSTLRILCHKKPDDPNLIRTTSEASDISLLAIQTELQQILKIAGTVAKKDEKIIKLLEDRRNLSQRIDENLPMIEQYIAKHYPVVELR